MNIYESCYEIFINVFLKEKKKTRREKMRKRDMSEKSLKWKEGVGERRREGLGYCLDFVVRVSDKNLIKYLTSIRKSTRRVLLPAALF